MAYNDYGAFVYCNGKRREDKEDVAVFDSDEETFGMPSEHVPSGARIWMSLLKKKQEGKEYNWLSHIHHGIMGDGDIRVVCHKQGLPEIYEATEEGFKKVEYCSKDTDYFEYGTVHVAYNNYRFEFNSGHPYTAQMIEPDGTEWLCKYDYGYGAGLTDAD